MININFHDPSPIYEQVCDGFRGLILSGALPDGYKMPSVRELASQLTINPNTIQRAYRELEAQGLICSLPGKGSFVSAGENLLAIRKAELLAQLDRIAAELRILGVSDDEVILHVNGGEEK